MVGGTLQGIVERDLQAELVGGPYEVVEVIKSAERGMHRRVPAGLIADSPRAAHIAGPRNQRVVRPLAMRMANGMDRGQIDDVEAERGELGEATLRIREGAVPPRDRALGA